MSLLNRILKFPYRYCKRYVDSSEGNNNESIAANGELEVIRRFIPHSKVVFDVGAHIGEWAKLVLEINPEVELHCFEPSLSTFEKLRSQKFPLNVICNNFGLSSQDRRAELKIFEKESGMNSLYRREGIEDRGFPPQEGIETITLRTLDDYCIEKNIRRIDYLKLDIEGHELEALRGAEMMLKEERISIIQFEYGGCHIDSRVFLKDFFQLMEGLAYEFYKILSQGLERVPKYSQKYENFQYSNWLLMKKDHDRRIIRH